MRYIATGIIHPERANIPLPRIEWTIPEDGKVVVQSDASQITVALELKLIDGWITAFVVAEQYASMVVNALGFSLGSGYSVEIIQITEEDGTPHVFGVRPENLGFDPYLPIFGRAFELANKDIFFSLALQDFLRAITDTRDCATYCYRAIESIKSAFVFKTGKDRWEEMHNTLGTKKETIDNTVKIYADPIRHGNWAGAKDTDSQMRLKMLILTRDILMKYLDHEIPST